MSQSTRSGSKHAIRLTTDEAEVRDALLDHTRHGAVDAAQDIDGSEEPTTRG
ncbi:hypothetical protein [Curtobacterium sp. ER1/6]|uniref:hypothetical protein n=1 Tax=Curtobacterium sp. ER1/6 TaxID=1891920 RepID=UPI00086A4988|nr:hypothetical protein [Curtobacterium sp. ER1/6]OEI69008.1 hypothetical protein Cus16_1502 [Curtobacterium sp. ER1/6]